MKILLVRPDHEEFSISGRKLGILHQPLGLLYLAAVLEQAGHKPVICDEMVGDKLQTFVEQEKPDLVGITTTTPLFRRVCLMVTELKSRGIPVIIGGPHVSALPEESLVKSHADGVVFGEGEETLREIANGKDWSTINGLAYMSGESVQFNSPRIPPDIDTIPFPARHLLDRDKYRGEHEIGFYVGKKKNMVRLFTSRGCPFQCTFCSSASIFGRKARFRNVDAIIDEMFSSLDMWQTNNLMFMDDTFTLKKSHVTAICEAMIRSGRKIRWGCFARAGLPEDLVALMKKAGCHMIGFGVESGSPAILEKLKKHINPSDIIDSLKLCRKHGIRSKAFVMVGVPGETEEDFQMTVKLCLKSRPDFLTVSIFTPLPGSEIMEELPADTVDNHWGNYFNTDNPVSRARHMELLRRFHLRPAFIANFLRNFSVDEIPDYWHMVKAFLTIHKNTMTQEHETH